jgi:hypothetical protein
MAARMSANELEELPQSIAFAVDQFVKGQRDRFDEKLARAEQRYRFVDTEQEMDGRGARESVR